MGYSYLVYMGLLCLINIIIIIFGGIERFKINNRKKLLLKLRDQRVKVIKAAAVA